MALISAAPALRHFPFRSGLTQKHTQQNRDSDADHPEQSAVTKMSDMVVRGGDSLAKGIGKQGSDQRGDAECQEVDPARGASLNLVWIDFFDDGVWNHRGSREDSEKKAAYYRGFVSLRKADQGSR